MIELTASDGHSFSAYRADPADTPKGAYVQAKTDRKKRKSGDDHLGPPMD